MSTNGTLDARARHRPRGGADRRRLLIVLDPGGRRHRRSVDGLLDVAGEVAANTANIPQLQATAPVLA